VFLAFLLCLLLLSCVTKLSPPFFFEEAKIKYITQNKEFFLAQGVPEKEQSHKHMYKGIEKKQTEIKKQRKKKH